MHELYTSKPSIGKKELKKVKTVFDSNWLGMGVFVQEFENELSKYLGVKNVIAVNSGTSALHLALEGSWNKERR
jgi:dTDP-4-amino-4,6-dideoxygalactose transaminase